MIATMRNAEGGLSRLDIALAAVLSALGLLLMYMNVSGGIDDFDTEASFLAVPLFLGVTIPVAFRRGWPLAAMGVSVGALILHSLLFSGLVTCGVAFPSLLLLSYSVASRLEIGEALAGLGLAFVGVATVALSDPNFTDDFPATMVFIGTITLVVWGTGRVVSSRVRLAGKLRLRNRELRDARDERAQLEIASDRARLSGELDELLQRRLGELASLADASAPGEDPERTAATLEAIETQSRQTLEEMRDIVGVLRADEPDATGTAPQPTLTGLDAMLVRAKGAGAALSIEGNPRTLPAGVELSAYRIVEHLLSALEDTDDVEVRVRFADDALELEVTGPSRRRATDAIERARERVQLHQGTLEATVEAGRSRATALLPVLAG